MTALSDACGIGKQDGDIGRASRGDPLRADDIFPSPRFNQTSALGQRSTMHWKKIVDN